LHNDAGQRRHGGSAIGPQFHRYRHPPRRVESGERLSGEAREPIERLPHRARVAAQCGQHIGQEIIGARHPD